MIASGWSCRWQALTPTSEIPASARSICPRSRRRSWSGAMLSASAGIGSRKNFCRKYGQRDKPLRPVPLLSLPGLKVFSLSMAVHPLSRRLCSTPRHHQATRRSCEYRRCPYSSPCDRPCAATLSLGVPIETVSRMMGVHRHIIRNAHGEVAVIVVKKSIAHCTHLLY